MAGDWIKMRGNLWDDPRVARICDITNQSEAAVIGALYWLWATADQHTEDGVMPGLTLRQIDRKTGVQGFGQALCDIGWLVDNSEGVRIVNFEEHNGTSAKRRATDAQRKASIRNVSASDADKTRTDDGQKTPKCGAREREEKSIKNPPNPPGGDGFDRFWSEWPNGPRKVAKAQCAAKWERHDLEAEADAIVAAVVAFKASAEWAKDNGAFVPMPATWLNQRRWEAPPKPIESTSPAAELWKPPPDLTPEEKAKAAEARRAAMTALKVVA